MENTFKEIMEKVESGVMSNTSRLKIPKDGIGIELMVDGKPIVVVVDKSLPTTFILSKISTLVEKIEDDIKERM